MTPREFCKAFYSEALLTEKETGISAIATLAQAAWESGWGKYAPGNMFFGEKDVDGINGNEQLITTTEYSSRANLKFPVIISITPVIRNGKKMFKYKIKDYFRKFNTPSDCFTHHAQFFFKNKRYAAALKVRGDYNRFFEEIAKAGYATDPNYAANLKSISKTIIKNIPS